MKCKYCGKKLVNTQWCFCDQKCYQDNLKANSISILPPMSTKPVCVSTSDSIQTNSYTKEVSDYLYEHRNDGIDALFNPKMGMSEISQRQHKIDEWKKRG